MSAGALSFATEGRVVLFNMHGQRGGQGEGETGVGAREGGREVKSDIAL